MLVSTERSWRVLGVHGNGRYADTIIGPCSPISGGRCFG